MSKIEEMEYEVFRMNRDWQDRALMNFASLCLNELKDLHEENCKIWKAIAELQIGEMQKFHDKIYENNLDNRKELNTDDKDNQKD